MNASSSLTACTIRKSSRFLSTKPDRDRCFEVLILVNVSILYTCEEISRYRKRT
jgi:hypothetical protein